MDGNLLHHVIIGNGGAGVSALQTIREIDKKSDITIISREKYPAYSPCSLPNLIGGEITKPKIFRFDTNFYIKLNAKFLKNCEAVNIFPDEKKIKLSDGKSIKFDKLLISAGAIPITPKEIEGLKLDGVHIMGTLNSSLQIINDIEKGVNHAVIVGGGFMGIETACMLKKRGIDVTVIEMLPNILSRMLDSDVSEKVEEILKKHDINLILNDSVKSINGKDKVTGVTLGKKKLNCDMAVLAIGVTPNIRIIKGSKIKINRGIIVDSTMKTNKQDIYAAGDIAEVYEQILGKQGSFAIWPNAIEQGRIAGLNMAGKISKYDGAEIVNVLDIFNIPIVAMGYISKDIGKCKKITRSTPNTYKKILIKKDRMIGLQFVGSIRNTGTFYGLIKKGLDISQIEDRLLDDNFIISPNV
jgi:NADPH-dependent 2,4-dienoyl-CoA reductase/sulfur reductase-like enzyme